RCAAPHSTRVHRLRPQTPTPRPWWPGCLRCAKTTPLPEWSTATAALRHWESPPAYRHNGPRPPKPAPAAGSTAANPIQWEETRPDGSKRPSHIPSEIQMLATMANDDLLLVSQPLEMHTQGLGQAVFHTVLQVLLHKEFAPTVVK